MLTSCEKKLLLNIKKEMSNNKDYFFVWDINLADAPEDKNAIHENIRISIPRKNIYTNKILKSNVIWKNIARCTGSSAKKLNDSHNKIVNHVRKLKYRDPNMMGSFPSEPAYYPIPNVDFIFSQNPEEKDDKLYCLCKKKWDGRLMVECDLCENWFHPDCIGINENDDVKLNMMYIICLTCKEHNNIVEPPINYQNNDYTQNINYYFNNNNHNVNGVTNNITSLSDINNNHLKQNKASTFQEIKENTKEKNNSLFKKLFNDKSSSKKFNALLDMFKEQNNNLLIKRNFSENCLNKLDNKYNCIDTNLKRIK